MTRDQAERLIERLADKYESISTGRELTPYDWCCPIMLTDVLDKPETVLCWEEEERKDRIYDLWCLWYECGITKSLQNIMLDGQFDAPRGKTVPSAPQDLFEYLIQLFPET